MESSKILGGHAAHMGDKLNAHCVLAEMTKGRRPPEDRAPRWEHNITMPLKQSTRVF
jgi:hypothetical protein